MFDGFDDPVKLKVRKVSKNYWSGINSALAEETFDSVEGLVLDIISSVSTSWDIDT